MPRTLTADDFRAAVMWLESNEGDAAERAPLLRVATWLEQQAVAKDLREVAKEHGVSVSKIRKFLVATVRTA